MESKIVCTQRKNDFSLKMAESKPVLGVSPPLLLLTISTLLATNVGGNLIEFLTGQYNPKNSCSYTGRYNSCLPPGTGMPVKQHNSGYSRLGFERLAPDHLVRLGLVRLGYLTFLCLSNVQQGVGRYNL